MKVTFHAIKAKRRIRGICTKCNKTRSRVFTAEQTVNPYNKGADGVVKTKEQIAREVSEEVTAKVALPFVCASCSES